MRLVPRHRAVATADPDWIPSAAWFESCPPLKSRPPEVDWIDAWITLCRKPRDLYEDQYEPDEYTGLWVRRGPILVPYMDEVP